MMGTKRNWLGTLAVLTLGAFLACAWPHNLRAEEDRTAQVEKLFREGLDLYQQGK